MFTAILMKEGERPHDVVTTVIKAAGANGRKFKKFHVLGKLSLGSKTFLRVKCVDKRLSELLTSLGLDHLVFNGQGSYSLHSNPTRIVGAHMVQAVADKNLARTYLGPGAEFWERQF
jgi:hypothetical protein